VGIVAANQGVPSRKAFPEALLAMSQFMKAHKDVYLYLHTDTSGLRAQGLDLVKLVDQVGISGARVIECDQYLNASGLLSPNYMARALNAIDVLLNPAYGEGFGLPVLEAQACGTPVIVNDHSAMREIGQVGWSVSGQKFYTGLGSFQQIPNVDEIVMALEGAYEQAGMMGEAARNFAVQYDADLVYENHWKDTVNTIGERVRAKQIMELEPV
jgi:glycosyltransferase involved in cell wall biosynthesis